MRAVRSPITRGDAPDMRLGLAVLAVAAVLAYLSATALEGSPLSSPYRVAVMLPTGSPVVKAGDEVRLGGERAGQVEDVTLSGGRGKATLTLEGARVGRGATARIRPRGLAGAVYVQLTPGDSRRPLPSGATLPASLTSSGVQVSDVAAAFDRDARSALRRTLQGYGGGVAGRGTRLNRALEQTPDTLARLAPELRAAYGTAGTLSGLTSSADDVAAAAAPRGTRVLSELIPPARLVLSATGDEGAALAAVERGLPPLEDEAARTLPPAELLLAELAPTARALTPAVDSLARALPDLRALELQAGAVPSFGRLAREARPVLARATPVAADAHGPAAALTALAGPFGQFAHALYPYRRELLEAPLGFTRWGNFKYDFGRGAGHKAVRFSMVFTCATARDPYPAPDAAPKERSKCP
jgi:ABC-type transporter Mla subunit MlaD